MNRFTLIVGILLLQGCYYDDPPYKPSFPAGVVEGYEPIYADPSQTEIAFEPSRQLHEPGKIYLYGTLLLVNERFEGIHIFDNADPAHPVAVGFLRIPGNVDSAIRNNVLYADHLGDLVALDVHDLKAPKEISRIHQAQWTMNLPPEGMRYFACVDPERGAVKGWRLATLNNPKCFH
ncbi:hypothetical protein WBG78_05405 [Chryseolinea sp. T2]|uniref:hypothetical protein n=1 Tax=Chryseolinea sp. T2 TaxID=3129255 RepID=UPI00307834A7